MSERILIAMDDEVSYSGGKIKLTWRSSRVVTRKVETMTGHAEVKEIEDFDEVEEHPYQMNEAGGHERQRLIELYQPIFLKR